MPQAMIRNLCLAFALGLAMPAGAARFHVLPDGERQSGPSAAGDWTPANCYPTLAVAAMAAGPPDTLLLSLDDHLLDAVATLPALIANRNLSAEAAACRVRLGAGGNLRIAAAATGTVVRGISLLPADPGTSLPALRVLEPAAPGSTVLIESCEFSGLCGAFSSSAGGAAIYVQGGEKRVALTIEDSRFLACSAGGSGGAIYASNGVDLRLQGCTFTGNESRFTGNTTMGGAVAVFAGAWGSSLFSEDCLFTDSICWGPGGAIYVQDSDLIMRDTEVRGSISAFGGVTNWSTGAGVFLRRANDDPEPVVLFAERCQFIGNRGDLTLGLYAGDGGGMMIRGSDHDSPVAVTIVDCLFADNFNDQGAGLYIGRGATGTVTRSLFLNNTAHSNGGGAYKGGALSSNLGETALFIYCVFAGNKVGWDQNGQPVAHFGYGGAFMTRRFPRAEFHNCTFADNQSGPITSRGDAIYNWGEGGFYHPLQRSRLVNCLFYGDQGNDVQVRSDPNGFTEVLNCAWQPGQFVAPGVSPERTIELTAPPFVAKDNWQLAADSPCVDAGLSLGYDHDFESRLVPSGMAPDIGAHEYQFPVGVQDPGDGGVAALRLMPAWPNPANPRTVIAFALARPALVRLTVHDCAGRLVSVLYEGYLPAAEHQAAWNGRTARGEAAPSGMYCVRLAAGGTFAAQKVLLVR